MTRPVAILVLIFATGLSVAGHENNSRASAAPAIPSPRPVNVISLQAFTNGALYSLNYERHFTVSDKLFMAGRIGVGYGVEFTLSLFSPSAASPGFVVIPHQVTANYGGRRSYLEFGMGGSVVNGYTIYPIIGYRFHPWESGNLSLRLNASFPLILPGDLFFIPFGGSLGIAF